MIEFERESVYNRYRHTSTHNPGGIIRVERLQELGRDGDTPIVEMYVVPSNQLSFMFTLDEAEELALVLQAVINTYKRDGE